jgi:hypothetical protein
MEVSMYRIALMRELAPSLFACLEREQFGVMLLEAKHRPLGRKGDRSEDSR